MSSVAMKWARQQHIEHAGLAHMVSVLAAVADARGQTWRAQLTLADDMAVTERCVRRYLRALEKLGVVQRAHRSNGRGGRSSDLIRLRLDRPFGQPLTLEMCETVRLTHEQWLEMLA